MPNSRVLPRAFLAVALGAAVAASALALASMAGCKRASPGPADARPVDEAEASVVPVVAPVADAASAPAPRAEPPKAVTTLIVQRVDSSCMACPEEPRPPDKLMGYDLLFEVTSADGVTTAKPEQVFCPASLPDGGPLKVRLGLGMMCRAFAKCTILSPDAGDSDRAELTCDREHVSVVSDGRRTFLTGSFGEREIAPDATRIAPPRRTLRKALHD